MFKTRVCVCVVSVIEKRPVLPPCTEDGGYWAIQRSWFARVNALCNLSRKKSREVTAHFRANFWAGIASHCV